MESATALNFHKQTLNDLHCLYRIPSQFPSQLIFILDQKEVAVPSNFQFKSKRIYEKYKTILITGMVATFLVAGTSAMAENERKRLGGMHQGKQLHQ